MTFYRLIFHPKFILRLSHLMMRLAAIWPIIVTELYYVLQQFLSMTYHCFVFVYIYYCD